MCREAPQRLRSACRLSQSRHSAVKLRGRLRAAWGRLRGIPKLPEMGRSARELRLKLGDVLSSDYFFA